jgi:hypothetical protein
MKQSSLKDNAEGDESNNVAVVVQQGKSKGDIRVRELWLGNLPETISENKLYSHFFIYGEIDKIEINPHKVR